MSLEVKSSQQLRENLGVLARISTIYEEIKVFERYDYKLHLSIEKQIGEFYSLL